VGRIVVNFDPGQAQARRKSRRWSRILALVALVVLGAIVVAAVGGFLWWRSYQSTPVYSLALLIDAAQRGDTQEMAKLIDDEELARNMIAQVNEKAIGRYGGLVRVETQQQIEKTISSLPQLKQTIHNEVAGEFKNFQVTRFEPFLRKLIAMRSYTPITTEGDVAKASATVSGRPVELTMRRDGDRWKVTKFDDIVVVQRIVDIVMKDLPPIGALDSTNPLFKMPGKPRKRRR
jgi:hypothetical protein